MLMLKFVFRRLTYSLPVLFGIFVVTFTLARAIPGDPCLAVLGERATKEICESFFRRNGLDQPAPVYSCSSICATSPRATWATRCASTAR